MISTVIGDTTNYLISTIGSFGYIGIFILMTIESTIFPLPSELVLIPAGVLVQRGEMSLVLIVLFSALGSLLGALIMYSLSLFLGRGVIDSLTRKYGKFLFIDEYSLMKSEYFFKKHGDVTIFISRLLPVVRHLVSIPAGISRMSVLRFSIYTFLGSAFWSTVLVLFGYFFGIALAEQNQLLITLLFVALCALVVGLYIFVKRKE